MADPSSPVKTAFKNEVVGFFIMPGSTHREESKHGLPEQKNLSMKCAENSINTKTT